jgi:hypothetical protein
MSYQDANQIYSFYKAQKDIAGDPSLSAWEKAKLTVSLDKAANKPDDTSFTALDFVKGAVGAGIGFGAGTIAAKFFGLSDTTKNNLQTFGMGMGTLMNMGVIKKAHERDTRYAFRYGFIKKAAELGILKQAMQIMPVPTLPLTPDTFAAPIRASFAGYNKLIRGAGTTAGALDSASDTDVEVAKMEAESEALYQKEEELRAKRANRLLSALMARRQAGA